MVNENTECFMQIGGSLKSARIIEYDHISLLCKSRCAVCCRFLRKFGAAFVRQKTPCMTQSTPLVLANNFAKNWIDGAVVRLRGKLASLSSTYMEVIGTHAITLTIEGLPEVHVKNVPVSLTMD